MKLVDPMRTEPTVEATPALPSEALLGATPLLSAMSPRHRTQMREHFSRHTCKAGAELVRQGHVCDGLFLLETGRVGAFMRNAAGLAQLMGDVGAPNTFGASTLLAGSTSPVSYVTLETAVIYRLPPEVFDTAARHSAELAHALAVSAARELDAMMRERVMPWVDLSRYQFDERLWANVPSSLAATLTVCPLALDQDVMTVAMADPRDVSALDLLKRALPGARFRIVAVTQDDLKRFVVQGTGARHSSGGVSVPPRARIPKIAFVGYEEPVATSGKALPSSMPPTAVVSVVDEIVAVALVENASDIHIEHERDGIEVRYRVDGMLRRRRETIAADLGRSIVSRLKLLAKLDITETRRPQDGRISVRVEGGRMVDLRVSTLPAKFGEKVALRILDSEAAIRDLRTLFPVERVRTIFTQLISRRTGLVLVSGPTGSGKSTTLYSALYARRSEDLNIMTVEDPIEYHIDGVTQVEVHPQTGTTFASVLRALLRQDPNIILVGEMRDSETARIAVEASLTGHLVLSSVHTGGAIEAVARLMDMGVESYAMANGLAGVMHQRLVQRLCTECAQPFEYPAVVMEQLVQAGALPEAVTLMRGVGCERCRRTGMLGRVAVHSVLLVNDAVREAISHGADLAELRNAAAGGAHLDLARYAGALLRAGFTVPSEVLPLLQRMDSGAT